VRRRDGSSPRHTILEDQSVWRRNNWPGAQMLLQSLTAGVPACDALTLWSQKEGWRTVYFELSHFKRTFSRPKPKTRKKRRGPPSRSSSDLPTSELQAWRSLPMLSGRC